jgi:hypothetical protein
MKASFILPALLLFPCLASAGKADRAVWIWEKDSYAVVEDTGAAEEALAFLRSKNINTLYLYADAFGGRNLIESRPELYRGLLRRLHGSGLRAYALLGSAYLHTEEYILPRRQERALSMLRRVIKYNASSEPDERFDGANLDLEPHVLDQWDKQRDRLLLDYLDLGRKLMKLKRDSGADLAVGPAIPFWLDGITLKWNGRKRPVNEHVQDIYDYAAVMDYRDHAEGRDSMVSLAAEELKYGSARGRKVVIGVDTSPGELDKVSFSHLAEADLERELGLAEKAFAAEPAFAGFAIHHYRSYRNWLEKSREKKAEPPTAAPGPSTKTVTGL